MKRSNSMASGATARHELSSSAGGRYGLLAFTEESASETDGPDSPLKKSSGFSGSLPEDTTFVLTQSAGVRPHHHFQ